ncbi:MAG TPA: M56 family metallopeptidase [Terriglobales bacterium]|nr:M56 family metallopeptidase [Terriglobales bacterium]
MTGAVDLQVLAQALTGRMLDSVVLGSGLAVSAAILLRALGRRDSSTRFAVWFAVLMTIAAMLWFDGRGGSALRPAVPAITVPASWALYALGVWVVGASVTLGRVGLSLWQLHKVRSSCQVVAVTDPQLQETVASFQSVRQVQICTSPRVEVPTVLGLVKPAVVLPAWTITELSAAELHTVVLHELAHLRRWDDWTNLAQKLVRAVLFFHPAVWWIESRLSLEREMACDDTVLAQTTNRHAYAQCLVSVAEKSLLQRSLALAQAVVGRVREMSARITRILDTSRPNSTRVGKPALGLVAALSIICLICSPRADRLVGFAPTGAVPVRGAVGPDGSVDPGAVAAPAVPAGWRVPSSGAAAHRRSAHRSSEATRLASRGGFLMPDCVPASYVQPTETVVLVVEGQRVDACGSVVWSVRVVRYGIYQPRVNQHDQPVPRKT